MPSSLTVDDAEAVAVEALGLITGRADLASRFLGALGLNPADLWGISRRRGFPLRILRHAMQDPALLAELTGRRGIHAVRVLAAAQVMEAYEARGGAGWLA